MKSGGQVSNDSPTQGLPEDPEAPTVSVQKLVQPEQDQAGLTHAVIEAPSAVGTTGSGGASGFSHSNLGKGSSNPDPKLAGQVATPAPNAISAPVQITKPEGLTSLHGLDRTALVRQVADKLHVLAAARSTKGMVVELAPKALGSLTLTVKAVGISLDASISASNEHVRRALEQSRPDIVQALQSRGFRDSQVTVSSSSSSTSTDSRNGQAPQRQAANPQARPFTSGARPSAPGTPNPAPGTRTAALDLWI